jgi:1,4-alpha-glucan branching enzyme
MPWQPWLGAVPGPHGTSFRVWAPRTNSLEVEIVDGPRAQMRPDAEGYYSATLEGVRPGARYLYRFPDARERPDPASLLQPDGVHGPSEVVDLAGVTPRARGIRSSGSSSPKSISAPIRAKGRPKALPGTCPSWPRRATPPWK